MTFESDREWKAWGEKDPFWAVASHPGRRKGAKAAWTPEEFYATGRADWRVLKARWQRYGLDLARCAEIGCGAGRLTRQLAADFAQVDGLDISEGMLAVAREHAALPNVTYRLSKGAELPLERGAASAVLSTFVFQHFDSLADGRAMFAEAARVLRPGGTMFIQLPLHAFPFERRVFSLLHGLRDQAERAQAFVRRRLPLPPPMRGLSYPARWLYQTLPALDLTDLEAGFFDAGSPGAPDPISVVLARRA